MGHQSGWRSQSRLLWGGVGYREQQHREWEGNWVRWSCWWWSFFVVGEHAAACKKKEVSSYVQFNRWIIPHFKTKQFTVLNLACGQFVYFVFPLLEALLYKTEGGLTEGPAIAFNAATENHRDWPTEGGTEDWGENMLVVGHWVAQTTSITLKENNWFNLFVSVLHK